MCVSVVCVCVWYVCAVREMGGFIGCYDLPQERYLASLMPLKRDVSPWRVCNRAPVNTHVCSITILLVFINTHTYIQPPPQLKPFNVEQFLKGIEGAGPHLTSGIKGNWTGLYRCHSFAAITYTIVIYASEELVVE